MPRVYVEHICQGSNDQCLLRLHWHDTIDLFIARSSHSACLSAKETPERSQFSISVNEILAEVLSHKEIRSIANRGPFVRLAWGAQRVRAGVHYRTAPTSTDSGKKSPSPSAPIGTLSSCDSGRTVRPSTRGARNRSLRVFSPLVQNAFSAINEGLLITKLNYSSPLEPSIFAVAEMSY